MASRSICVTDTNLWIDLDTAGLLDSIFGLPLEWLPCDRRPPPLPNEEVDRRLRRWREE